MYGCLGLTARPVTCSICPVRVSLSWPEARSQILMVRSALPVQNHSLLGSTAIERTQPKCPEITRYSFQGACQSGLGHLLGMRLITAADVGLLLGFSLIVASALDCSWKATIWPPSLLLLAAASLFAGISSMIRCMSLLFSSFAGFAGPDLRAAIASGRAIFGRSESVLVEGAVVVGLLPTWKSAGRSRTAAYSSFILHFRFLRWLSSSIGNLCP
mmetsp:Transcript_9485/g.19646  ORF Transcript_9485/g.19646 Transcript_9485/m.19646 type:complete len:215 (-) Transcript_9485:279-923(-)